MRRKTNTKDIIGTAGVREILTRIAEAGHDTRTVCIGGVNESNVQRILFQSAAARKPLDGVAVVSAIMAAPDPEGASRDLLGLVKNPPAFQVDLGKGSSAVDVPSVIAQVPSVIKAVHDATPLTHNMTNLVWPLHVVDTPSSRLSVANARQVVQNFSANVALAVGASPIMANYGEEAPDLCKLGGALVINMGTVTPDGLANYLKALRAYNRAGRPVVFDPVGYVHALLVSLDRHLDH